jgi:hypothetical protein
MVLTRSWPGLVGGHYIAPVAHVPVNLDIHTAKGEVVALG